MYQSSRPEIKTMANLEAAFAGESMADVYGIYNSITRGLSNAARAFKDEMPVFAGQKLETTTAGKEAIKGMVDHAF